jgi:hypothetical protein
VRRRIGNAPDVAITQIDHMAQDIEGVATCLAPLASRLEAGCHADLVAEPDDRAEGLFLIAEIKLQRAR